MRRLALVTAVALVLPVLAWRVVVAEPPAVPTQCDPTATTATATTTLPPTTTTVLPPPPPPPESPPPESPPPESTTTTLPPSTLPGETTTTVPETTTTVPATTTTVAEPATTVAEPPTTIPCDTTTTAAPTTTIPPTTTTTTIPPTTTTTIPPTTAPETTAPETTAPETTIAPTTAPATTIPPVEATTTVAPSESTTTLATTPPAPQPETTLAPAPLPESIEPQPETTVVSTPPTTTTPATTTPEPTTPATTTPATTTTTVPEDLESAPVVPSPPSPGGRGLAPVGVSDTGQVRPIVFPVAGPVRYGNDFGVCRDGCRRQHKGVDIIGDRLQPLLAMRDGVVDRLLDHPTAGFGVVIRDAEGWEYHQYHMNNDTPFTDDGLEDGTWRFAEDIVVGGRVTAGQVIGWMGDSGNSEGSVPHTHVEIHTPERVAINPFWSLRHAQRDVNCGMPPPAGPVEPTETTLARVEDPQFLASAWSSPETVAALPGVYLAVALTGGRPTTDDVAARMWVGADGFTPIDVAAAHVGDRRYDDEDCTVPTEPVVPTTTVPGAPPVAAAPPPAQPIPAELGAILATIRAMETGGNYRTQVTSSTASGAYAFLDSSWGGYGGFRRARDAPPPVQDAKAAELAAYVLNKNNGDVSTIPVSWYIGHVPRGAEWDTVPPVGANVLTPREYQARWMAMYAKVLGTPDVWVTGTASWAPLGPVCHTVLIDLAGPDQPAEYALTQVGSFVDDGTGRAIPAADDPCDPNRPAPAPPTTTTTTTTVQPGD